MIFYIRKGGKKITLEIGWFWIILLIALVAHCVSCGQWEGGDTDHSIDCIDGCSNQDHIRYIQGPPGKDGTNGKDGQAGASGESGRNGKDGVSGSDGKDGTNGAPGQDGAAGTPGAQGVPGINGTNGSDGYSIVATTQVLATGDAVCPTGGEAILLAQDTNRNGIWDSSDLSQQLLSVCNGVAGANGTQGPSGPAGPALSVSIIDPCGDAAGIWDEVVVRLPDGRLLASFSDNANGQNTRFSVLSSGSYVTTDGSHCYFSVDGSNNVINQHY